MNSRQFSVLSEDAQLVELLADAICIAERDVDGLKALLFQKGAGYIEVLCIAPGDELVTWWQFNSIEALEPYLDAITLPRFLEAHTI